VAGGWVTAPPGTVLVVEGIFLHRDELTDCWDLSIFLDVPFEVTARRMAARDGSNVDLEHPRYIEGQRIYLHECDPRARAHMVIDNTDPSVPVLVEPAQDPASTKTKGTQWPARRS
jgi:uridine kinase